MSNQDYRVGIDVGGTFTDVVAIRDGTITVTKVPSTPASPDKGVINGLRSSHKGTDWEADEIGFIAHGTTVATNAVLEREWAETALITTEGFRDVLEIGRQARPDLYDLTAEKPTPVVPRDRRFEVPERIDERGRIERELDEEDVEAVVEWILESGTESVAISLLFAFENDEHERRIADILESSDFDGAISLSSRVLPEIREYERSLTTAFNAGLKPVMDAYIGQLDTQLTELGVPVDVRIMQSNGGIIGPERARDTPINTLLSGPAAGVQGAAHLAAQSGSQNVITMDMGGTSCDVSLVRGGEPVVSTEVEIGEYPIGVPMIEVHTIGAGGGSIAWLDAGGALRVGPRSAGADPGPICYGHGGTQPTVTDAHALLGRIDPGQFLPAGFDPAPNEARSAIATILAEPLGLSVEETAAGILEVANANMERALRVVSVERGHDPREFALVAFGGAGPLHAPTIARSLDIPRVIVPRTAGVLSALGLLISDLVHDFSTSRVRPWAEIDPAAIEATFEQFAEEGRTRLRKEGIDSTSIHIERSLDLRYRGQSFSLQISTPNVFDENALDELADRFHDRHRERYGHASPAEPLELVTIRLRARGLVDQPTLRGEMVDGSIADAIRTTRPVMFYGHDHDTDVYDRELLPVDGRISGPAIIEGRESTVVVHPDQLATVDGLGTLVIESQEGTQ